MKTRYPADLRLQGYTGHVAMQANRTPYRQPYFETADAVFARGDAPVCVMAYVGRLDGVRRVRKFVDSPAPGPYHSYLCDEIVPWVDAHYRTIPEPASRAISGKSSGGFGR
jgi:enterochelin esterase-like enzyme